MSLAGADEVAGVRELRAALSSFCSRLNSRGCNVRRVSSRIETYLIHRVVGISSSSRYHGTSSGLGLLYEANGKASYYSLWGDDLGKIVFVGPTEPETISFEFTEDKDWFGTVFSNCILQEIRLKRGWS